MDIKEFVQEKVSIAQQMAIENDTGVDTEMARMILTCMEDADEVLSPDMCELELPSIRITAFDYNDEAEVLDLFLYVKASSPGGTLGATALDRAYNRLYSFYLKAIQPKAFSGKDKAFSTEVQDAIEVIRDSRGKINTIRLFVLTDGVVKLFSQATESVNDEQLGVVVQRLVWDMSKVFRAEKLKEGVEDIDIDFETSGFDQIPCLRVDDENPDIVSYLTSIPGEYLAAIYNEYSQLLLEKNVRTFLRNKSKVNRKIAETLKKCPTKFFAYNNGISATAKSVEFGKSGSMKAPMLKRITDLQIVNGGQTTASIALLAKEGVDISKVFVPMKINVVRDEEHYKETIKAISVCANSQTPIKESDFESGDEMLKELEKISRSEATPKTEKKWYFERMRGQYSNERNSFSGYEKKMFEEDYPKENVITKTDIARVVMLWEGKPHIACNSREKCFDTYIGTLRKDGTTINVEYFHYIIALTILYKRVYETARAMCKSGDFVSRVTAYAMSALAELSEHRLNLSYIWTVQMLQPELEAHIQRSVAWAQRHLMQNQTRSWARSLACWEDMKEMLENCPKIGENLLASEGHIVEPCDDEEQETINRANAIQAREWFDVFKWAVENDRFSAAERKKLQNLFISVSKGKTIRKVNQAEAALDLIDKAKRLGFDEWEQKNIESDSVN